MKKHKKIIKAIGKSLRDTFFVVPIAFFLVYIISIIVSGESPWFITTSPYSYFFWAGVPICLVIGYFIHYDEENKI